MTLILQSFCFASPLCVSGVEAQRWAKCEAGRKARRGPKKTGGMPAVGVERALA
jgi:hypothetical protein